LVLGGCGIQRRAAVYDLTRSEGVEEVICADARMEGLHALSSFINMANVRTVEMDASNLDNLVKLFNNADAAIDLLPRNCGNGLSGSHQNRCRRC
jgi:saccharopine dehydrogenase-like NADP-dependent oxidoreductase